MTIKGASNWIWWMKKDGLQNKRKEGCASLPPDTIIGEYPLSSFLWAKGYGEETNLRSKTG